MPLLRTKAVRRVTSPWAGSTTNVAMYHWLSGNFEIGPRSTLCCSWPRKDGRTAKPATGSVIRAPIAAPRPSVVPSRKTLRVTAVSASRNERDSLLVGRRGGHPGAGFRHLAPLGLDGDRLSAELGGRLARPEDREDDGDRRADRRDQQRIDDQPDENDDDPDRKADRIQRRCRQMRLLVERLLLGVGTRLLRLHQVEVLSQRPVLRREN